MSRDAGAWDLTFEKGNRRCRLTLRTEAVPGGYAVAMPSGCHKAFPTLASVTAWSPQEGGHVAFVAEGGASVLDFGPGAGPGLSAVAGEGDTFDLLPSDPDRQMALVTAPADAAVASASVSPPKPAPAAPVRPMSVTEVAGHYAVLRTGRDTGCMVTLEEKDKGPKASLKARLAPACRDQGIVIFDPVGWLLSKGEMVLMARKGHTTELTLQDDGTWANAPVGGRVLMLKRL